MMNQEIKEDDKTEIVTAGDGWLHRSDNEYSMIVYS